MTETVVSWKERVSDLQQTVSSKVESVQRFQLNLQKLVVKLQKLENRANDHLSQKKEDHKLANALSGELTMELAELAELVTSFRDELDPTSLTLHIPGESSSSASFSFGSFGSIPGMMSASNSLDASHGSGIYMIPPSTSRSSERVSNGLDGLNLVVVDETMSTDESDHDHDRIAQSRGRSHSSSSDSSTSSETSGASRFASEDYLMKKPPVSLSSLSVDVSSSSSHARGGSNGMSSGDMSLLYSGSKKKSRSRPKSPALSVSIVDDVDCGFAVESSPEESSDEDIDRERNYFARVGYSLATTPKSATPKPVRIRSVPPKKSSPSKASTAMSKKSKASRKRRKRKFTKRKKRADSAKVRAKASPLPPPPSIEKPSRTLGEITLSIEEPSKMIAKQKKVTRKDSLKHPSVRKAIIKVSPVSSPVADSDCEGTDFRRRLSDIGFHSPASSVELEDTVMNLKSTLSPLIKSMSFEPRKPTLTAQNSSGTYIGSDSVASMTSDLVRVTETTLKESSLWIKYENKLIESTLRSVKREVSSLRIFCQLLNWLCREGQTMNDALNKSKRTMESVIKKFKHGKLVTASHLREMSMESATMGGASGDLSGSDKSSVTEGMMESMKSSSSSARSLVARPRLGTSAKSLGGFRPKGSGRDGSLRGLRQERADRSGISLLAKLEHQLIGGKAVISSLPSQSTKALGCSDPSTASSEAKKASGDSGGNSIAEFRKGSLTPPPKSMLSFTYAAPALPGAKKPRITQDSVLDSKLNVLIGECKAFIVSAEAEEEKTSDVKHGDSSDDSEFLQSGDDLNSPCVSDKPLSLMKHRLNILDELKLDCCELDGLFVEELTLLRKFNNMFTELRDVSRRMSVSQKKVRTYLSQ